MKGLSQIAVLLIGLLSLMLTLDVALADKRVALVIGNSAYSRATKLANPENDAQDIAQTLKSLQFDVIFRTNIDRRGLDAALEEFERKAVGADTAMFFFAGHGLQYRGRNYLLPIDADLEDEVSLRYNTLAIDKVRDALDAASGVKIMILDACRNNPLSDKLVSRTAGLSRSAEMTRGLARLDRTEGMVVAYATQADQVAQDGVGRNSPFSSALIRRLSEPNLEIATLFRRVAQDVYEQTGGRQRPELSISLLQDFYLNMRDDDSRVWRRISPNATEADLQEFITKFPGSPYVRDAQSRLYVLQTLRQEREVMNKRLADFEAQRLVFEKQEEARRQADQQERERRQKDTESIGRLAIERAERERQETQRRESDRIAKEKVEQDRLAAEKAVVDRQVREQAEAKRIAEEKAEKERLAAVKRDEERKAVEQLAAEKREQERLKAERLAADLRAKEQQAANERERKAAEAERLAAEKREQERLAVEKRDSEQRIAAEKKEAERIEKERIRVAALEEDTRRKAEAAQTKLKQEQACSSESAEIKRLSGGKDKSGLQTLRAQLTCSAAVASLDKSLSDLVKAQEQACVSENRSLRTIAKDDLKALKLFVVGATCDDARLAANDKIAKLETEIAKAESVCAGENDKLAAIRQDMSDKAKTATALKALQSSLACEKLRPVVAEAINLVEPTIVVAVNTPDQIKSAQNDLGRIGCYSGQITGALDKSTLFALTAYLATTGGASKSASIGDDLVKELKGQPTTVCKLPPSVASIPPAKAKPAAEKPQPKKAVAAREEEDDDQVVAPRQKAKPVARPEPVRPKHVSAPAVVEPHHMAAPEPRHAPPPAPTAATHTFNCIGC